MKDRVVDEILEDYKVTPSEAPAFIEALKLANVSYAEIAAEILEDGVVLDSELEGVDTSAWVDQGISIELRRAWHLKSWMPSLPSGRIFLEYDFRMIGDVPVMRLI